MVPLLTTTPRERVQAAIRFEPPDRLPRHDSPWTQTVERWRREGLPADITVEDHFGFDLAMMFLDASPRFPMEVLERRDGFITYADRYGYTMRKVEHGEGTIDFRSHQLTGREARLLDPLGRQDRPLPRALHRDRRPGPEPLEVQAGLDTVELRGRLGENLAFYGNISARSMAGPREKLEAELLRKIPLARQGGYIMHSDHSVPPDVSFEQFSWMQRRAQEIFRP